MLTISPTEGASVRRRVGGESAASIERELQERLIARRDELEAAVLTRVYAVSDPSEAQDPTYLEGLKAAVRAAVDYGLEGITASARNRPPLPPALLVQARIAARSGIGLDTVLRRYFAGYALLGDFLFEEAEAMELSGAALKPLLRVHAEVFDRLVAAISEEHAREAKPRHPSSEDRKAELIKRLLDGERIDTSELAYELEGHHHVAILARGEGIEDAIRDLSRTLDRRLLLLEREEGTVWAWLGGVRPFTAEDLRLLGKSPLPQGSALALGEPGEGPGGWRRSHLQANAALPIAMRGEERCVRYADVAPLASVMQDELLVSSLRTLFIEPLEAERDGGEMLRETLRSYFLSERNLTSAAALLGVSRQAIAKRLEAVERYLGRSLGSCSLGLELALGLEACSDSQPPAASKCRKDAAVTPVD